MRALIARCCGNERAPVTLHERIRVRITEISVDTAHVEYRAD